MRESKGFEIKRWGGLGIYLCAVAGILFTASGCGEQLTRMEENQIKLQAMVAANARELATLSSQVHAGTLKIGQGLQNLDTQTQGIAAGVQTVQNRQTQLQETVVANHRNLEAKTDALREGQQSLGAQVTQVQDTAQRAASDLTALAQHQAGLRETMLTNQQELNTHIDVVVNHQQALQAGVVRLHEADESLARSIASVAGKQDTLSTTVQENQTELTQRLREVAAAQKTTQDSITAHHTQTGNQLAGLITGQQDLHARIDGLNAKADKALLDSATAVASLQETLRTGHEIIAGQMAASLQNQQTIRTAVQDLHNKTDALSGNLAGVATEQVTAKETARAHHDEILAAMAGLSDGHQSLRLGIEQIDKNSSTMTSELAAHADAVAQNHRNTNAAMAELGARTQKVSAELDAMASAQDVFRRQQLSHNEAIIARMTGLAEGQQALRGQVDLLTATTSQTALSMLTLNNSQATFQQAMQAGMSALHERADQTAMNMKDMIELNTAMNRAIADQARVMTENQRTMKTDLARIAGVVDRTYADLTAVSLAQDALQNTLATRSDEIGGRIARLDNNQKDFLESLNVLTATAGQTALDVLGLTSGHVELNRTLRAGNDAVIAHTTALADHQKTISHQLDVLTATTSQTASDVIAISDRQNMLADAVRAHHDSAATHLAKVAENQRQIHSGLDVLTATAGQTALDVIAAAERQTQFAQAVQSHQRATDGRIAKLDENQQKMQSGLDTLVAAAGQTVKDLNAVMGRQEALALAMQNHDESMIGRMEKLDENQQKTQGGIETVATTAGQAVRDIAALSESQAKSDQTAQAGRLEITARLTEIAQGQQGWIERFDAAQTRIQAMADGIATLDRQLAGLQNVLQSTVQATGEVLEANEQHRRQFEAKIAQDVQTMIDALSQLRQTQAQLQEQMNQVHKTTQSQADTLKTTIEQLKAAPIQQPSIEVKIGDAAKSSTPAVVQTGE